MNRTEQANHFGLRESDLTNIVTLLSLFEQIEEAVIFGSRAKGNFKNGSDVDIAIKGNIDLATTTKLSYMLNEETLMPYKFDIVNYTQNSHEDLKKHIDRVGITIYDKNSSLVA